MKHAALTVAAVLIFAGGKALADPPQKAQSITAMPEYRTGYSDGCSNAVWGTGPNHPRSDKPVAYKVGWVRGYNACRNGNAHSAGGLLGNVGGNAPNPNN